MGDHVALPERDSGSSVAQCRICHEEEDNDLKDMESPCACSGTLKYAHRKCIQRWCNEKEDTVCEICLQKFEPGFTVTAQTADVGQLPPLIRELHISSENQELQNPGLATTMAAAGGSPDPNFRGSSFSTCCRLVALMFTALLLILHALNLLGNGGGQYALTLFALFLLRAGGVLLPFYIMVHAVSVIQRRQQAHGQTLFVSIRKPKQYRKVESIIACDMRFHRIMTVICKIIETWMKMFRSCISESS